jgi:outer membrane protein
MMTVSAVTVNAQEKIGLSLEEAVRTGFEKSPILAMSELSVRAAEAEAREARTALFPSIKLSGSYNRLSGVPEFFIDVPLPGFPEDGLAIFPNIVDHYGARVSLQQPLYTGSRLSGSRDVARYNALAESYGHQADKNELEYMIAGAYWSLYRAREMERVVEASIEQLNAHLAHVENYFEEGLVTRSEVLKVRVQVSNSGVRLLEARNNARVALIRLNHIIGLPLTTEVDLTSDPGFMIESEITLDHYVSIAVDENPSVRELDSRKQMSHSALGVARSGWYPHIYLSGNYYYQRPHQRYLPLRDEFNDSWDIGIAISFDLWNWRTTSHRTSRARAQLRQTEYALEKRRDELTVEVTQHYLNVQSASEQVDAARIALQTAEENYRIAENLFAEDMAINTDVLDANVALQQARMNYIDAMVKYEMAQAGLARAVGTELK